MSILTACMLMADPVSWEAIGPAGLSGVEVVDEGWSGGIAPTVLEPAAEKTSNKSAGGAGAGAAALELVGVVVEFILEKSAKLPCDLK